MAPTQHFAYTGRPGVFQRVPLATPQASHKIFNIPDLSTLATLPVEPTASAQVQAPYHLTGLF